MNQDDDPNNTNPPMPNKSAMVLAAEERRKQKMEQMSPTIQNHSQGEPIPNMRMDLIQKATQFLTNSTVKDTPASRKIAFLKEKKGLTQLEIEEAFRQCGQEMTDPISQKSSNQMVQPQYQPPQYLQHPQSIHNLPIVPSRENRENNSGGWKNTLLAVAAVGGLLGFGVMMAKNYSPWIASKITGKEYISPEELEKRRKQEKKKKKKKNAKKLEKLMEEKKKTERINTELDLEDQKQDQKQDQNISQIEDVKLNHKDIEINGLKEMVINSLSKQSEETDQIFQSVKELLNEVRENKSTQIVSQKLQSSSLNENKESLNRIENIVQNVKSMLSNRTYSSSNLSNKPPSNNGYVSTNNNPSIENQRNSSSSLPSFQLKNEKEKTLNTSQNLQNSPEQTNEVQIKENDQETLNQN